jgi:hypothetical protein
MLYVITQGRLLELLNAEKRLCELEDAGVDNWEGYGEGFEAPFTEVTESYTIEKLSEAGALRLSTRD